jgi:hypothetical protein
LQLPFAPPPKDNNEKLSARYVTRFTPNYEPLAAHIAAPDRNCLKSVMRGPCSILTRGLWSDGELCRRASFDCFEEGTGTVQRIKQEMVGPFVGAAA